MRTDGGAIAILIKNMIHHKFVTPYKTKLVENVFIEIFDDKQYSVKFCAEYFPGSRSNKEKYRNFQYDINL